MAPYVLNALTRYLDPFQYKYIWVYVFQHNQVFYPDLDEKIQYHDE